jgi:hypothetical protein
VEVVVKVVVVEVTIVGSVMVITLESGARFSIPAWRAARLSRNSRLLYGIERPLKRKWASGGAGAAERFASAEAVMPARVGLIVAFLSCFVGLVGTLQVGVTDCVVLITVAVGIVLLMVKVFVVVTVTREGVTVRVGFRVCSSILVSLFVERKGGHLPLKGL